MWALTRTTETPYQIAKAEKQFLSEVKKYLKMGYKVDMVDDDNKTYLHQAAMSGHEDVAAILLTKGAYVSGQSYRFMQSVQRSKLRKSKFVFACRQTEAYYITRVWLIWMPTSGCFTYRLPLLEKCSNGKDYWQTNPITWSCTNNVWVRRPRHTYVVL